jgi:septal ring factor EnvC (AmiA/AmiB activator)
VKYGALLGCLGCLWFVAPAAHAQEGDSKLQDNKEKLEKIRQEQAELQQKMERLQSTAHDIRDEVHTLDRQHDAAQQAMETLDQQLGFINNQVTQTTASLVRTQDEAVLKRAILRRRLIDIYKRGALYDLQALLSADSFGELVARYKYLHEIALRDRAMLKHVEDLKAAIRSKHAQLVSLQSDVQENRQEKEQEEERLKSLEQRKQESLARVQADTKKTQGRLREVMRAESHVNSVIANLERARRRSASRTGTAARGANGTSSIRTSDLGKLAWPVDGNILYRFGRLVNPSNNTVTRWNGIGIAAAPGTAVRAVAAGTVRIVAPMGTYGRCVILEHGGGDYSIYCSLGSVSVAEGDHVTRGEKVGTVGVSDPDMPPHLHFEIRQGSQAIDPADWLRSTQ